MTLLAMCHFLLQVRKTLSVLYPNVGTHTLQVHAMNTKEQPERKVREDGIDTAMTSELNSGTSAGMGLVCKGLKRETTVLLFRAQLCTEWDYVRSHRTRRPGCSRKAKCHASPEGRKHRFRAFVAWVLNLHFPTCL